MAEKANTRGRKPATKKVESVEITEEVVDKVIEEKPVAKETKKEFGQEDGILCRSITEGLLKIPGEKSGMSYRFPEYGTEVEIEYRDLIAIVRSKVDYITHPYIVILDDDFINQNKVVKDFYDNNYPLEDLRRVLSEPVNTMIEIMKKLPKGAVACLRNMVATDVSLGRINEIDRLTALNNFYGIDFNITNEVFDEG